MKHNVFLFLGEDLLEIAAHVTRNVLKEKDNSEVIWQHFTSLLWITKEDGHIDVSTFIQEVPNEEEFHSDEEFRYKVCLKQLETLNKKDKELRAFFSTWYANHVVSGTEGAGDNYQMTIVMNASDIPSKDMAISIAKLLDNASLNYAVDILLLSPDTYSVFLNEERWINEVKCNIDIFNQQSKTIVKNLIDTRKSNNCIGQIVLLQNRTKNASSLQLDMSTLSRIISEYVFVCIENYLHLYNPVSSFNGTVEDNITGLGISCLDFDRIYFLNYLLHHAYIYIMEREGVKQAVADVNKVSQLATETLHDRTNVLSNFYELYVQSEINKGKTGDEIVRGGLMSHIREFFNDLEFAITKHINDDNLSLPEKSALMAQILLKDEDMLSGYLYNKDQPAFIDFFQEPINYFVDHYNASLEFEKDETGTIVCDSETGIPIIKDGIITEPQNQEGYIYVPIEDIKKLRMDIQQCSEFIRQRTIELEELEKIREDVQKADDVVIDDDNYFRQFKLIGDDIREDPLKDNYEPKPTKETNIDLSHDFTPIKNQGPVGACTTFAVTAVYEYILKKNDRKDHDLSERFLYYNARESDNRLDKEGVAISTAINSIGEKGICLEEKWPYSFTEYNTKPSEEAYLDAEARKVKKALNIVLTGNQEENRDALRSAIAEGYPVIISLNLFDAFDHVGSDGMVPTPSPGDSLIQREGFESTAHAMVACGFDDKNQVFLVRNSWGERFGKDGYCYIPYAYICNHEYLNNAYIITEVTDDSIKVRGIKGRHKIVLDMNDIGVKIVLVRNAIAAKKKEQDLLIEQYRHTYSQYEHLVEILRDPNNREEIVGNTREFHTSRYTSIQKNVRELEYRKQIELGQFTKRTLINKIKGWGVLAMIIVCYALIVYVFGFNEDFLVGNAIIAAIGIFGLLRYSVYRKNKLHELEANLNAEIDSNNYRLAQEKVILDELNHRQYVAGTILDNLAILNNNLQTLQLSLYNYVKNLSCWYDEETQKVNEMTPEEKVPFRTTLDNNVLNNYFQQRCEPLTKNIKLYRIWVGNYQIGENEVFKFKNHLKVVIKDELAKDIDGFNIYEYIAGIRKYPYLANHEEKDLRPVELKSMNEYSKIFLQLINSNPVPPSHNIYVMCPDRLADDWIQLCRRHTSGGSPQCAFISSPYKVVEIQLEYIKFDNISIFTN